MPGISVHASRAAISGLADRRRMEQMNISTTSRQKVCRVNLRRVARFFSRMAQNMLRISPDVKWSELSLVLTDNAGIKRINSKFLHVADTTDVIAFRYAPIPGEQACPCGEIFVNVERAMEKGPLYGNRSRELALYIAHGCDHMAGQSDDSRAGYSRMRRRELRWLKEADEAGLLRRPLLSGAGRKHPGTT